MNIKVTMEPLPFGSYIWTVYDISMVKRIQNASNVYVFASPIFELHGFKWYITFYPNGSKLTSFRHLTCSTCTNA